MADDEFKYDVAFSFLVRDEQLARGLNDRLQTRVRTFIYSDAERQVQLAGRDGEEAFAKVFGEESRIVVVLYRDGWGESGFTAAEATAIRNRAFTEGLVLRPLSPWIHHQRFQNGSRALGCGLAWSVWVRERCFSTCGI